jgi:chromosome segregation ATPase
MTVEPVDHVVLSDEATRAVEDGIARYEGAKQLAEERRLRIEELEARDRGKDVTIETLRRDLDDVRDRLAASERITADAVAIRTQYETLVIQLAGMLNGFIPTVPRPRPLPRDAEAKAPGNGRALSAEEAKSILDVLGRELEPTSILKRN